MIHRIATPFLPCLLSFLLSIGLVLTPAVEADAFPGRLMVADAAGGPPMATANLSYYGFSFQDWVDPGDRQWVGDFLDLGYDQLMLINSQGSGAMGRVKISDLSTGNRTRFWHAYNESPCQICGWYDEGDIQLVGDFMDLGHDQVMFINNTSRTGRVMIRDFSIGNDQSEILHLHTWDDDCQVCGWSDPGDTMLVGDFMNLGHDQVMFINNTSQSGRVMIRDFSIGNNDSEPLYYLTYDDDCQVCGYHDPGDLQLAGDFMNLGYDQVMFVNRYQPNGALLNENNSSSGRIRIKDFSGGNNSNVNRYELDWGDDPCEVCGWLDPGDRVVAGDFMGLGYDQAMFLNRFAPNGTRLNAGNSSSGRAMVRDFATSSGISQNRYWENWGDSNLLDGWNDDADILRAGDLMGLGHEQTLWINPEGDSGVHPGEDSSYNLTLSQEFRDTLEARGDFEIMIRQGCDRGVQAFTHNDSIWLPVTQTLEYELFTAKCRKSTAMPRRFVREYEVKLRPIGGQEISCGKTPAVTDLHAVTDYPVPVNGFTCSLNASLLTIANPNLQADAQPQGIVYNHEDLMRFAPSLRLCSSDPYRPVAADDPLFLDHVRLRSKDDLGFVESNVTPEILGQYSDGGPSDISGDIYYLESIQTTSLLGNPDLDQVPLYVRVKTYSTGEDTIAHFVDLQYISFFGFNGYQHIEHNSIIFYWPDYAAHEGDWEHVTVRVTPDFTEILEVFYSGHGDGTWRLAEGVDVFNSTHPVVYVACQSHSANYEMGSIVLENRETVLCGHVSFIDYTGNSTVPWEVWQPTDDGTVHPERLIELGFDQHGAPINGQSWLSFAGSWGPDRVNEASDPVGYSGCLIPLEPIVDDLGILDDFKQTGGPKTPPQQRWWRDIE